MKFVVCRYSLLAVLPVILLAYFNSSHDSEELCSIPAIDDDNIILREELFRLQNSPPPGTSFEIAASLSVPVHSSKPGAPVTLVLDFDGHPAHTWGEFTVPATPAYDSDGNAASFTAAELSNITKIWQRTAESYAPFNVNVTTVDPGSYSIMSGVIKIIIGGDNTWLGGGGGVAYISSFNASPRWGFCFTKNLGNGNTKFTADCIAHEAGHMFGLRHQAEYSGTTKTAEYSQGDAFTAPIMGVAYYSERGLWWHGPNSQGWNVIQNDIPYMTSNNLYFAIDSDDHSNSHASASVLAEASLAISGSGTIETLGDVDVFTFSTGGGAVTIEVSPFDPGGMLDVKALLKDSGGATLASAAPAGSLSASFSTTLADGTYYLHVLSQADNTGDLGRYKISGTIPALSQNPQPTPTPLVTPTATPTPRPGNPITRPTPGPATPTPTPTPIGGGLELLFPSSNTIIKKKVTLRFSTGDLDLIRITEKPSRSWTLRAKKAFNNSIKTIRYPMIGKSSKVTIAGYKKGKLQSRLKFTLKPNKPFDVMSVKRQ